MFKFYQIPPDAAPHSAVSLVLCHRSSRPLTASTAPPPLRPDFAPAPLLRHLAEKESDILQPHVLLCKAHQFKVTRRILRVYAAELRASGAR